MLPSVQSPPSAVRYASATGGMAAMTRMWSRFAITIGARLRDGDGHAAPIEDLDEHSDGGEAAVVYGGARPVEDDGLQGAVIRC
ncbi:MAG: hypothetical protein U0822_26270 [Anaerolineae bacterium]